MWFEGERELIEYIRKRDGRKVIFDKDCITKAIFSAASEVAEKEHTQPNYEIAEGLSAQVVNLLNKKLYIQFVKKFRQKRYIWYIKKKSIIIVRRFYASLLGRL